MAKIAAELDRALAERAACGAPGGLASQLLAGDHDWTVTDVICTSGPADDVFDERHSCYRIAIVGAGTFQYRAAGGRVLTTPGSLLLGHPGQRFECGHEHDRGDRCLSFGYAPEHFERLASDAGVRGRARLDALRVPPLRDLAPLAARAWAAWAGPRGAAPAGVWHELSTGVAAAAVQLTHQVRHTATPRNAEARVTSAIRMIDSDPGAALALADLAREARLSPYHFLRTFARSTGLTPHRYVLRARLREAATRLAVERCPIIDIALDSGFRDVSNFNRAFRAEFGMSPRAHRSKLARTSGKTS